jgi:16S rRNA (adenine1518-N6/adenine1519-N6)-dimethyltransferase
VVRFDPLPEQPAPALLNALERVTAAAFGQRRKMLRGSLKGLLSEQQIASAGIAPDRRPETLTLEEFATLAGLL